MASFMVGRGIMALSVRAVTIHSYTFARLSIFLLTDVTQLTAKMANRYEKSRVGCGEERTASSLFGLLRQVRMRLAPHPALVVYFSI